MSIIQSTVPTSAQEATTDPTAAATPDLAPEQQTPREPIGKRTPPKRVFTLPKPGLTGLVSPEGYLFPCAVANITPLARRFLERRNTSIASALRAIELREYEARFKAAKLAGEPLPERPSRRAPEPVVDPLGTLLRAGWATIDDRGEVTSGPYIRLSIMQKSVIASLAELYPEHAKALCRRVGHVEPPQPSPSPG